MIAYMTVADARKRRDEWIRANGGGGGTAFDDVPADWWAVVDHVRSDGPFGMTTTLIAATPWESQARRLLLALAAHDGEQIRVESLRG